MKETFWQTVATIIAFIALCFISVFIFGGVLLLCKGDKPQ